MLGSSDDGREDRSWSIVSGESGLDHTGAVVNNKGGAVFINFSELRE